MLMQEQVCPYITFNHSRQNIYFCLQVSCCVFIYKPLQLLNWTEQFAVQAQTPVEGVLFFVNIGSLYILKQCLLYFWENDCKTFSYNAVFSNAIHAAVVRNEAYTVFSFLFFFFFFFFLDERTQSQSWSHEAGARAEPHRTAAVC